ncbi:alpha/beta hydrolase [Ciceribacter ferrooxidans]|uniref:Alpha/beta fold hydrolase n=1 Tax=Ciceribacter ferrooxidans TaxID=2509717 RepID=A0A4Q2T039_9HYPH|nr:alpha/beta fold hydrolase [Ciceribacter ferrooxidans]RYC11692.1 alpha/beta fold hydrolase [Ciceribacter ferrooxidans]
MLRFRPDAWRLLLVATLMLLVTGCVSRPTEEVLTPRVLGQPAHEVIVLAATNRKLRSKDDDPLGRRSDNLGFERYRFSVPANRPAASIIYPTVPADPRRQFIVTDHDDLTLSQFSAEVERTVDDDGTVGVFVHGYNYSHQEALFRTAQLGADARTLPPPILFSWPSQASLTGYVADKDEALASRTELTRLLVLIGRTQGVKHIVLFAHSMGSLLAIEAVRQLELEKQSSTTQKLDIVLAAADIDVDLFLSQLNDIGRLPRPITLLVSKEDKALGASSFLGRERPRVGTSDVDDARVVAAAEDHNLRLVDITGIEDNDGLGHDRYVNLAKSAGQIKRQYQPGTEASISPGVFVFDAVGHLLTRPSNAPRLP